MTLERQKLDNAEVDQRLAEARSHLAASVRQTCGMQQEARQKRDKWRCEKQRREARISSPLGTKSKFSSSSVAAGSQAQGTVTDIGDGVLSMGRTGPSLKSAAVARDVRFSAEAGFSPSGATNTLLEQRTNEIRLRSESITNELFGAAPKLKALKVPSLCFLALMCCSMIKYHKAFLYL